MRLLGVLMLLMGSAGVVLSVRNTLERSRPGDVAFALLTLLCVILALLGLTLLFVPGFLG